MTTAVAGVIGFLLIAAGLRVGIEALLRRLGIQPADPAARSGGFADVLRRLPRDDR